MPSVISLTGNKPPRFLGLGNFARCVAGDPGGDVGAFVLGKSAPKAHELPREGDKELKKYVNLLTLGN